jgi:hypothetical protein
MPPAQIIQKVAFDGPLSVGYLAALGAALALVTGFFVWREWRAGISAKLLAGLFFARLAVLAIVLWMLAGPSMLTIQRETQPKSVVFLVDSSASMGLSDPVDGSGSTVRWGAAEGALPGSPAAIPILDGIVGTLQSARGAVLELRQLNDEKETGALSAALWEQVRATMEGAAGELDRLAAETGRNDAETGAALARVPTFLKQGAQMAASRPREEAGRAGDQGRRQAEEDRLDAVEAFLNDGFQRVDAAAQKLAARGEQTSGASGADALAAESARTRKEKTLAWLERAEGSWMKTLENKARVTRYTFASSVLPVADRGWREALTRQAEKEEDSTDINGALSRAAQEAAKQPVDAVVLVTDGGHNTARDPREGAAALRGIPTYIVPIGTTEMPRDVVLHHTHSPRAVFKNDTVVVDSMVTAYDCQGEQLRIDLLRDGVVADTQKLAVDSKIFDGRIRFQWKAEELGRHALEVRVAPVPREHSLANNEARVEVDVMKDTIRVLIADDFPRWEFRYLTALFKRDKHIDFEQLLFEPNDTGGAGSSPEFPRDPEAWRRYRVVILGDVSPAHFPPARQEMLKKYVTEGGGNLIVVAGETAMPGAYAGQPLGSMIPSTASPDPIDPAVGLGLVVTAEGSVSLPTQLEDDPLASERIWREMSAKLPVFNLSEICQPKPTSHVLIAAVKPNSPPGARAGQKAYFSWEYAGAGRVVYLAAPISYQLRYANGDLYHHRFWGQLLRWAIARDLSGGSKTVRLAADKDRYEQGGQAQIVMRLLKPDGEAVAGADASVEARMDGRLVKVLALREEPNSPGAYRGTFDGLPAGGINIRAAGRSVQSLLGAEGRAEPVELKLDVDPQGGSELSNPLCNLSLLGQIADAAGGSVIPPGAVQNALARLDETPRVKETTLSSRPLWDRWSLFWILIACLTFEWIARKHYGIV